MVEPTRKRQAATSIKDVAQHAGVAVSSVSRALAGHPDVSAEMRKRVEASAAELGYRPNGAARTLRRGVSMSVGFVVGDISNPLMSSIALAAETRLAEDGYSLLLANSQGQPDRDAANIKSFGQRSVDGLLLSLSDEHDQGTIDALAHVDKPAVLLDRDVDVAGASSVRFDHARGFAAAAEHLVILGHRNVCFVSDNDHLRPARARYTAVLDTLRASSAKLVAVIGTESSVRGRLTELLHGDDRPTAIICASNMLLPAVLEATATAGQRIPDDMTVITTDNTDLADFYQPRLARVSRDRAAFGQAAAALLLSGINGGEPSHVTLTTGFDPAESCAPPRARSEKQ